MKKEMMADFLPMRPGLLINFKSAGTGPDLPAVIGLGENRDEVIKSITEGIQFHLESMEEDSDPIPEPQTEVETIAF